MNNYDYIIQAFTRDGNNTNLEVNNLDVGCITSLNNNFELDSNGNLTVNTITANNITAQAVANAIYPVGSIYMSVSSTNPSSLFGGVWERIEDRFLLGSGSNYTSGDTGGASTHTIAMNELPGNVVGPTTNYKTWATGAWNDYSGLAYVYTTVNDTHNTQTSGVNSRPFSIMPPYLVVYIWKRIS